MEMKALVELIVEKFYDANGYSDLSREETSAKILQYLEYEYQSRLVRSTNILKKEESINGFANLKRYEEEHERIEDEIIELAKEMAAVSKQDLEDLVKPS
jgi:hypothetical protein